MRQSRRLELKTANPPAFTTGVSNQASASALPSSVAVLRRSASNRSRVRDVGMNRVAVLLSIGTKKTMPPSAERSMCNIWISDSGVAVMHSTWQRMSFFLAVRRTLSSIRARRTSYLRNTCAMPGFLPFRVKYMRTRPST